MASRSVNTKPILTFLTDHYLDYGCSDLERFVVSSKIAAQFSSYTLGTGWSGGDTNTNPASQKSVSSYDALDQILQYFDDKTLYPNLHQIVVAGMYPIGRHSAYDADKISQDTAGMLATVDPGSSD